MRIKCFGILIFFISSRSQESERGKKFSLEKEKIEIERTLLEIERSKLKTEKEELLRLRELAKLAEGRVLPRK